MGKVPGVPGMVRSTGTGLVQRVTSAASGEGVFNTYTVPRSTDDQNWTDAGTPSPDRAVNVSLPAGFSESPVFIIATGSVP